MSSASGRRVARFPPNGLCFEVSALSRRPRADVDDDGAAPESVAASSSTMSSSSSLCVLFDGFSSSSSSSSSRLIVATVSLSTPTPPRLRFAVARTAAAAVAAATVPRVTRVVPIPRALARDAHLAPTTTLERRALLRHNAPRMPSSPSPRRRSLDDVLVLDDDERDDIAVSTPTPTPSSAAASRLRDCFKTPEGRYNLGKTWRTASTSYMSTSGSIGVTRRAEYDARHRRRLALAVVDRVPYVLVNVGDCVVCVSYKASAKDKAVKKISFNGIAVTTFAWRAKRLGDRYDLLVGLANGEVHAIDLGTNLSDKNKKATSVERWNAKGEFTKSRVTAVVWRDRANVRNVYDRAGDDDLAAMTAREDDFSFDWIALHADGSLFTYDSRRDGAPEGAFPPLADPSALSVVQATNANSNPIERWHFGRSQLTAAAFAPDCDLLAIVNGDGMCRIIDVAGCRPTVVAGFKSYYAGFNAVKWSLCGRYVIAGGESDMIEIWGWYEREVIAWACGGHRSWICDIGVDDVQNAQGDGRALRFVSVGEDCRIAIWDVVIPGDDDIAHPEHDDLMHNFVAPAESTTTTTTTKTRFSGPDAMVCQAAHRDEVPRVVPLMTHKLHDNPVSAVAFTKEGILTAALCDVKLWLRPESSARYVRNEHEYSD